jgi:DivIVA domain-containing protein
MTLTLDDVRNKRFRMARKSGYDVLEVDEFVDAVEVAFGQFTDENQNLAKQVESLKSSPGVGSAAATGADSDAPAGPETLVVTTSKEASSAVVRLVELSTEQSERLLAEATEDSNRIREEANRNAQEVTSDARTRAERLESEARVNAERVQGDALGRAEALDRELDERRTKMFSDLESERDQLAGTINELRAFETQFRGNLAAQIRQQLDNLERIKGEPDNVPDAAQPSGEGSGAGTGDGEAGEGETSDGAASDGDASSSSPSYDEDVDGPPTLGGGSTSDTPRLDALLRDQR